MAPGPVAGCPEIVVAGGLGLFVVGKRRGRLIRVFDRLIAVAGIVRALVITLIGALILGLGVVAARVGI